MVAHGGVGRYQPRGLGQTLEEIPQGRYTGLHDPRNVGVDPGLRLGLRGRPALHCADVDAEVVGEIRLPRAPVERAPGFDDEGGGHLDGQFLKPECGELHLGHTHLWGMVLLGAVVNQLPGSSPQERGKNITARSACR